VGGVLVGWEALGVNTVVEPLPTPETPAGATGVNTVGVEPLPTATGATGVNTVGTAPLPDADGVKTVGAAELTAEATGVGPTVGKTEGAPAPPADGMATEGATGWGSNVVVAGLYSV
jgi:hypothetical protein